MRRGQASDVTEGCGGSVAVQSEQQKIADRGVVQFFGNFRMLAQAIERVAEKKKLAQLGVVKRFHSQMIARAKQQFLPRVPDRESEIPAQVLYALHAPRGVCVQNQFGVS